jgi:hypothetical protein
MTESKIIKINLKTFIEDIFIAISSKDEESFKELDEKFTHFFSNEKESLKDSILYYIKQTKLVLENECLVKYFNKFSM